MVSLKKTHESNLATFITKYHLYSKHLFSNWTYENRLMIFYLDDYELVTQMAIFSNIWTFEGYHKISLKISQNALKYALMVV